MNHENRSQGPHSLEASMNQHKAWHSRGYLPHFDSPETVQYCLVRDAQSCSCHRRGARQSSSEDHCEKLEVLHIKASQHAAQSDWTFLGSRLFRSLYAKRGTHAADGGVCRK